MIVALIADVHANLLALEACLAAARTAGADHLVFLGDLVGYGAEPEEVVARVSGLAEAGAIVIRGNHDEAALRPLPGMNPVAQQAIEWTRGRLSGAAKSFLDALPLAHESDGILYVHADATAPARWIYVTDAETARGSIEATAARVTFCGHVHVPRLYCRVAAGQIVQHTPRTEMEIPLSNSLRWLAVIGSAGQPRDGNPAAAFALYHPQRRSLTYCRAAYDVEAAAAGVRRAGLPEALAMRLLAGS